MLRQNQMIIYKCQNLNERMHSIDLAGLECRNYLVYRLLTDRWMRSGLGTLV